MNGALHTQLLKYSYLVGFLFLFSIDHIEAQQTVGLFNNTPESFNGYTLFAPRNSNVTYLINNCGEKVHSWSSTFNTGLSYVLENGILLRTGKGGIVEMIDWDGSVIWSHSVKATHGRQHHDIKRLPNGNILLIVHDERTRSEVLQAGSSTSNLFINSEQIVEIKPDFDLGGATVVWEWKVWDHLIQDADSSKDNFGSVSQNPERININFLNHNSSDWLHINGIDYNEALDQIILSVHHFSEFWIIDHSTSTLQAADSVGGKYGQGGDLLYRWGNPQTYDQGSTNDQKLFFQHDTHWIEDSLSDAGKILLFNNQAGTPYNQDYSTVNIVDVPVDSNGFYSHVAGAFGPIDFDWTYRAPVPTDFYSSILSSAQRLPNGNTLICEGVGGRFFEIDNSQTIVWMYVNPVNDLGPIAQETIPTNNDVFQCLRYAPDYPGFEGKTLTPQGYIETGSTFICDLFPAGIRSREFIGNRPTLYPNPAKEFIKIRLTEKSTSDLVIDIFNGKGQLIINKIHPKENRELNINLDDLNSGIYFVVIYGDSNSWSEKIVISK